MRITDPRGVEDELEAEPAVERLDYFDQRAAYEEFQELFADEPELSELVTPDILPPSFRLGLTEPVGALGDRIVELMERRPGVREVSRGPWADPVDHERELPRWPTARQRRGVVRGEGAGRRRVTGSQGRDEAEGAVARIRH